MARNTYLFLFIVLSLISVMNGQTMGGPMHGKVVVCYIASWAVYRPGAGSFSLDNLEPSLCTHLVYAFAGLKTENNTIVSLDNWQDLEDNYGKGGYKRLVSLKKRYPHLKVTIAIGGWNEGSIKYSQMAETFETRSKFIASVLQFLNTFKFDGLDLDWEYPGKRDGRPQDRDNYVSLVKELKEAFQPYGYILTAAFGAGKDTMDVAYDLPKLNQYLDLIHMMCYDYHGKWDGVVGANAPLRGSGNADVLSVDYTINYMLQHGVSPSKLVLGLPMYGRTFLLQDPDTKNIEFGRTPVQSEGFDGPFTKEKGFMGYNEICRETSNKSSQWTHHWHDQSSTPYIRDKERVVTYDNERSIAIKVKLAIDYGLRGLMVWSIDTDDFRGSCSRNTTETYIDFVERYNSIADSPLLQKALMNLNLPDVGRTENVGKGLSYVTLNGKLQLNPPQPEFSNYALMRTINEATSLALEEKKIFNEMEMIERGNTIDDSEPTKPGSSCTIIASIFTILLSVLVTLKF